MAAWSVPRHRSRLRVGLEQYLEELAARPGRLVAAVVLTIAGVLVLWLAPQASAALGSRPGAAPPAPVPTVHADPTISVLRSAASTCPGLDWTVLAGIYAVETSSGRSTETSRAGARGPMQFLPATWTEYGVDADGSGHADVQSLPDAALGAARMLCANGGGTPSGLRNALYAYNHSWSYVERVLGYANGVRSSLAGQRTDSDLAKLARRGSRPA